MSGRFETHLKKLRALPEIDPPADLEPLTLEAMARAADVAPAIRAQSPVLAKAAALVVAAGLGSAIAYWAVYGDVSEQPVAEALPPESSYFELIEQSALLEELLATLPEPRRVMRAGTASTIVGLEDRIALIDAELYLAESQAAAPEYRQALLRDRVEVMNALVNVRYAQSRAFSY